MDAFWQWVESWNKPGTLGDVLPWLITSVVAVAASLVTVFRKRAAKRRDQALQVACWIERLDHGRWVARLRNSSRNPIHTIAVLVGDGSSEMDSGAGALDSQFFSMQTLGPERSTDLPLRPQMGRTGESGLIRLYFDDHTGHHWLLREDGKLVRQRNGVADNLIGGVATGARGISRDHSGTLGSDFRALDIADATVYRRDIDPEHGNSISISFLPEGVSLVPHAQFEMRSEDSRVAWVELDEEGHLIQITICNLPKGVSRSALPRYLRGRDSIAVVFGKPEEPLEHLIEPNRIGSTWIVGGKHTTWGDVAHVALDKKGNLLALIIPTENLVPGFLPPSPA